LLLRTKNAWRHSSLLWTTFLCLFVVSDIFLPGITNTYRLRYSSVLFLFVRNAALTTVPANKALLYVVILPAIRGQCREKLNTGIATHEGKSKEVWKNSERNYFAVGPSCL